MTIVFLIIMGLERPGGRRYFSIARELVRQGHHIRILALHPDLVNCPQRRFVQDGVEIWYVGQMHARKQGSTTERFGPLALLRVLVGATLGMIWGVICSPADVYHLGKPQPVNGLAALIAVCLLQRKRFYVDWDDDEVTSNRLTAGWQRAVFGFWQWLLPRLAAGVTVNTRFLERRVRAAGQHNVAYVPNGVSDAWFTRPPERQLAGLRAGLGLTGKQVIAYVGTLSLQNHPVDLLLEVFALLAPAHPKLALLIVGGGEDLELLREWTHMRNLRDRVYFTGHVAYTAVPTLLALAAVSVDPVHNDATARARSPLKIVESLALGVPVVTGDVGDRREMVGAGGTLVQAGDAAALASGIEAQLMARYAASRSPQVDQFCWKVLAMAWATVYGEQLS